MLTYVDHGPIEWWHQVGSGVKKRRVINHVLWLAKQFMCVFCEGFQYKQLIHREVMIWTYGNGRHLWSQSNQLQVPKLSPQVNLYSRTSKTSLSQCMSPSKWSLSFLVIIINKCIETPSTNPTLDPLPLVIVSTLYYINWLDKRGHNMWWYCTCKHVSLFLKLDAIVVKLDISWSMPSVQWNWFKTIHYLRIFCGKKS